jgi:hypothetical protein
MSTAAFTPARRWSYSTGRPASVDQIASPTATVISIKPQSLPSWLDQVVERINAVALLEEGWDGEEARPLARGAALAALNALVEVMWPDSPAPSVVPMYDGGLQLEWHAPELDIELTSAPDGMRQVWIAAASGLEIDNDFRYVVEDLRKHIGTLTRG